MRTVLSGQEPPSEMHSLLSDSAENDQLLFRGCSWQYERRSTPLTTDPVIHHSNRHLFIHPVLLCANKNSLSFDYSSVNPDKLFELLTVIGRLQIQ